MHMSTVMILGACCLAVTALAATEPAASPKQQHKARTFEAEAAKRFGGASTVSDRAASKGRLVSLSKPGQGIEFTELPAAGRLAVRYASANVGTISVAINDQPARKVNVHSSGALTNSFLHSIVELAIPAKARLKISWQRTMSR